MSFLKQHNLGSDGAFIAKVKQAMLKSALAVMAEATDEESGPTYAEHQRRAGFAGRVLSDPVDVARQYAFAVASNATLNGASSDNDIEFTVNSQWDAWSGVSPNAVDPEV